ncbi:MAG: TolC family protein [Acidobacteria bacterium]|nr:TolC family protein [Acidobacteriota bacterium]MBV9145456.1 TolC family protein [Acidobacteriota bacterium]MBV9437210.1 TolC family protein [Acidobacteriota bacterium]
MHGARSFTLIFTFTVGHGRNESLRYGLVLAVLLALGMGDALAQTPALPKISLDQAVQMALDHNHALLATRTQVQQNQAQEITAAIHPNPVFSFNSLFLPFTEATAENINTISEFDVGVGYTFERGRKRQHRIEAARAQTSVTRSQVADAERALVFNVSQQFINALQAKANIDLAQQDLNSFQQTVNIAQQQYKAGAISEGDLLKIQLQLLQFQTDISQAQLSLVQALAALRQLVGYDSVSADYDVEGQLEYQPLSEGLADLQAKALSSRPDLRAAQLGVTAAKSQYQLARANGKRDLSSTFQYSHVAGLNTGDLLFSIEIPIFDRNQGEIARTRYAITQSDETAREAEETVLTDVRNAYESQQTNQKIVQLYVNGYLKQSQDSRDISAYAYQRGAASLLDFLDAERSYRATQLGYHQAVAAYMLALEQLKQAVGTRSLP